jgi:hypothetical protein
LAREEELAEKQRTEKYIQEHYNDPVYPGSTTTLGDAYRVGGAKHVTELQRQNMAIGLSHDKQTAAQKKAVYDSYTTRVKEYQRLGPMFQPKYPGETPDARAKQELESSLPGSTRIIEEFVGSPKQGESIPVIPPGYSLQTLKNGQKVLFNPNAEPGKQYMKVQ